MIHRKLINTISIICLCIFSNIQYMNAQNKLSTNEIEIAVDSIFEDKTSMTSPGASVIVLQDEKVLLSKNYGAANLTFDLPFDENTLFPLSGFTEQLVVFSILQLEKKGQLKLSDPVNKHLPELGFQDQVTLSHLINHSSGFPVIGSLRLMAGWNFTDPFNQNDFLNLTKKFTSNLTPDKKIRHNHSGVKILEMVVEKASGNNFSDYAAKNIFEPLKMTNTVVEDEGYRVSKNSSIGYNETEGGYREVNPMSIELVCPATYSTQADFQKWMANFQSRKFEGEILEKMDESLSVNGKLQEKNNRSYLIGQHRYWKYLGQDEFYLMDTGGGYSWKWIRLMDSKLSIMVVGNLDSYIGSKVNAIANLLVDYEPPVDASEKETVSIDMSKAEKDAYTGFYWNDDYYFTTEISIKDGGLYYYEIENGWNFPLTPRTKTIFDTPPGHVVEISNTGDNKELKLILSSGSEYDSKKYDVRTLSTEDQLKYEGLYSSDKLNAIYRIILENDKLILRRSRKPDLELIPIGTNRFRASEVDFRLIEFNENNDGTIQKMKISNSVVQNVEFLKLN